MAVVEKKRKSGPVYFVVLRHNGKIVWERAGSDKREAERLEARRKREMAAGTYRRARTASMLVGSYLESWLDERTIRWADDERGFFDRYVLARGWLVRLRMDDIEPHHIDRLVDEMEATVSEATGATLSPKTVANIYGSLSTAFKRAVKFGIISRNPCMLERGRLVKRPRKVRKPYQRSEVAKLLTGDKVSMPGRVFAGLALFTGMREGEICGRRWADYDADSSPLGCLLVDTQYDGRPLKTGKHAGDKPRRVPVHPALAELLDWWRTEGFELVYCRKPTAEDPIVPAADGTHHTKSSAYKLWRRTCAAAGVENLSLHSTRHTFLTYARRGGARPDVIETVTHNAAGRMIDQYTHWEWEPLCEAVLCLDAEAMLDGTLDGAREGRENEWRRRELNSAHPSKKGGNTRNDGHEGGKVEPRGFSEVGAQPTADVSAVEHLPPGYAGTRVEVGRERATVRVEPGDTRRTVNDRLAKVGRALARKAAAS